VAIVHFDAARTHAPPKEALMATYQSGTDLYTDTDNWSEAIGSTLEPGVSSNVFYIQDLDGAETEVTGTGFTYNANQTAVTGGTITQVQKFLPDGPSGLSGEQITGLSLDAATFWNASTGAQKFADLLSGDDTFSISTPITAYFVTGLPYALDGYRGSNVLNLQNDNDGIALNFLSSTSAQLIDLHGSQDPMPISNFSTFTFTDGLLVYFPGNGTSLTQTISGGHDTITSAHTGANSITLLGVGSALSASSFHFA
jgi:hypothetical protein